MNTAVMGGGNMVSVCTLLLLVNCQFITGKPFFGAMFCDLFCEDDDDLNASTPSTTTSLEDAVDALFDPCTDCPTRRPTTPRMPTMAPGMQPFNFMIPPSPNGMNLTMVPRGNTWQMNFAPWNGPMGPWGNGGQMGPWGNGGQMGPMVPMSPGGPGGPATMAAAATNDVTTAATTAAAGATTAAAGTTTAAAGATTPAADATTAAPATAGR